MATTESPTTQLQAKFQLRYRDAKHDDCALDVDLVMPGKGITAIFGQSGSGKTSLLRCIAGLERAQQGHLVVNGNTWQSATVFVAPHKRPLGYVFQESSLFSHLTAEKNLQYALKRAPRPTAKDTYQHILKLMGIAPILQRYPSELSGGERQRVAITRALLIQPSLLLMDEPLASLDSARKQEILPYLEKLRSAFDIPILYVSHSVDEIARLADHVVLLQQGRAITQGSIAEVFSRIDVPLAAGNGASVVWQGEVIERDKHWQLARVACAGGTLWVADTGDALGARIRVRILASDISLALNAYQDTSFLNRLPVMVSEIAPEANGAMALVRLKTAEDYLLANLTRRSVDQLAIKPGQQLWAQIKSAAVIR